MMSALRFIARLLVASIRVITPLVVLAAGVLLAWLLLVTGPQVPRVAVEPTATRVEVVIAQPTTQRAVVTAFGAVQADRQLTIRPQVGGRIVHQHARLTVGGIVSEGDLLLRIDPSDYQLAVAQRQADLTEAQANWQIEQGRQIVAQHEWDLLEPSIPLSDVGRDLALRRPHLQQRRAAIDAAAARLSLAELDLQRTTVACPFNALVIDESVEVGQLVSAGNPIATLVCTDAFHVLVSMPTDQLAWITLPDRDAPGSSVRVSQHTGLEQSSNRAGHVERLLGDLDPEGRMARLLVRIDDPLNMTRRADNSPPLLLGAYVRVEIDGPLLQDVVAVPPQCLREGDQIWIMTADDRLEIRPVKIVLRRDDAVLIRDGLSQGDRIISTILAAPVPGMLLTTDPQAMRAADSPDQP